MPKIGYEPVLAVVKGREDADIPHEMTFWKGLLRRKLEGCQTHTTRKSVFFDDLAHYITDGIRNLVQQCLYGSII